MVARNLERRSSFLYPELDVAPRPNYFLIEPPLYAEIAVLVRRLTGLPLGASGRVVRARDCARCVGTFRTCETPGEHSDRSRRDGRLRLPAGHDPLRPRVSARCAHDRLLDRGDALLGRLRSRTTADLARAGVAFLSVGLALKIISAYVFRRSFSESCVRDKRGSSGFCSRR